MNLLVAVLLFIIGLVCIVKGGDYFVDAASWFSEITGIPKLIVGATVVSFATTLPELLVSVTASIEGVNGIATGNAIGSVACNTGLIMGISILMMPVPIKLSGFLDKGILLIVSTMALTYFGMDGQLVATEAMVLFALLGLFFYFNVSGAMAANSGKSKKDRKGISDKKDIYRNLIKFVVGVTGIVIGARLLVDNGEMIALAIGVPASVVGLTLVALGTSLPELVTTLTAISKKESNLSIGNILGANTIDITMILSTCALLSSDGLALTQSTVFMDLPVTLLLIIIAVIPPIFTKRLMRWQGGLMIAIYLVYVISITFIL